MEIERDLPPEYLNPFTCAIEWSGDTTDYDTFPRTHQVKFPRGQKINGSTPGQAYDATVTNPEELLAAALGTCMMLTFLAVCSRAKINVVSYKDHPQAIVELEERRLRVTRIILEPEVSVQSPAEREWLHTAMEKAHGNCIVALSVRSEVLIRPVFQTA